MVLYLVLKYSYNKIPGEPVDRFVFFLYDKPQIPIVGFFNLLNFENRFMYLSSCLSLTSSIALGKLKSSFLLFKYLEKFKLSLGKHGPEYNAPNERLFFPILVSCPIAFSIFDVLSLEFLSEICEIVFVKIFSSLRMY